jgi:hypothetical protein
MQRGVALDRIVFQGVFILEVPSGEDQMLLVRRNTFLVLKLYLDLYDRVSGLDLQRDVLPGQCLYVDPEGSRDPRLANMKVKSESMARRSASERPIQVPLRTAEPNPGMPSETKRPH